jgi:hypothetical protein
MAMHHPLITKKTGTPNHPWRQNDPQIPGCVLSPWFKWNSTTYMEANALIQSMAGLYDDLMLIELIEESLSMLSQNTKAWSPEHNAPRP